MSAGEHRAGRLVDRAYRIDALPVPLTLRRSSRARRLTMRLDTAGDRVIVVIPADVATEVALRFATTHAEWARARLARLPARVLFADGAEIPVLGVRHGIRYRPDARPQVTPDGNILVVGGATERVAARVTSWLRWRARHEITPRVAEKAARLGRAAGPIVIRDTRSRWASCAASGRLSFSWRLVMAPRLTLDYVVAHEVAHLAVAAHNQRFWHTVAGLADDAEEGRAWLRRHGRDLHRYG